MSKRNRGDAIGRRGFLKGATAAGAALGATAPAAAQTATPVTAKRSFVLAGKSLPRSLNTPESRGTTNVSMKMMTTTAVPASTAG